MEMEKEKEETGSWLSFGGLTHLHTWLGEADPHGDLLAHKDIRIVCLAKAALQFVQLRRREACAVSLLLVFVQMLQMRWRQRQRGKKEREREGETWLECVFGSRRFSWLDTTSTTTTTRCTWTRQLRELTKLQLIVKLANRNVKKNGNKNAKHKLKFALLFLTTFLFFSTIFFFFVVYIKYVGK